MRLRSLTWIVMLAPVLLLSGESHGGPAGSKATLTEPPVLIISPKRGLTLTPVPVGMGDGEKLTLPNKRGDYQLHRLYKALVSLRTAYAKLPPLNVHPTKGVPWWVVVQVVDTARRTWDGKPLFPVVFLGVGDDGEDDQ